MRSFRTWIKCIFNSIWLNYNNEYVKSKCRVVNFIDSILCWCIFVRRYGKSNKKTFVLAARENCGSLQIWFEMNELKCYVKKNVYGKVCVKKNIVLQLKGKVVSLLRLIYKWAVLLYWFLCLICLYHWNKTYKNHSRLTSTTNILKPPNCPIVYGCYLVIG